MLIPSARCFCFSDGFPFALGDRISGYICLLRWTSARWRQASDQKEKTIDFLHCGISLQCTNRISVTNCDYEMLYNLELWCSTIYIESPSLRDRYIAICQNIQTILLLFRERENAVCFYMNCFIFEAECVFNFEFVREVEP